MRYQNHHRLIILALLLTLVQGCGQRGPLYFPDDPDHQENRLSVNDRK